MQENQEQRTHPLKRFAQKFAQSTKRVRARVHRLPGGRQIWRVGVGVLGLLVIVVGIVLLPLPGPGWAIIFLGLGIWATEFEWAKSLLKTVRRWVARWVAWIQRQSRVRQILAGASGAIVIGGVAVGAYLLTTA